MAAEALLFPGQGSHADGMEAPYRGNALLERGLELLGQDPFSRLGEGTRTQQPALFLCSLAAWDAAGRPPAAATTGHSLGEYAALVAAGLPAGLVALLGGELDAVAGLAAEVGLTVANDNAPGQVVLSGRFDAVGVVEGHAHGGGG